MKWKQARFSELFRVKHGYAFKSQFFDSVGPYVLLTPGNFHEEGGFRDQGDKQKHYTGDVPPGFILNEGDLLVAMTEQADGLLGSSAWIPESNRYLHNQRLGLVVDLNEEGIDKRYLYYLFNTREVRHQISGSASGTKVKHTAPERIGRVEVGIPPLSAQQKIATIVTAYDDLMENNRRRMELLEEAARQLYREWFVRLRFPGCEHTRIVNGVLEGWEMQVLEAVCVKENGIQTGPFGSQLHQSDYTEDGVPVVMPQDLINFRIVVDDIARTSETLCDKLSRHKLQPGDIVYGRRGDIGRRAFVSDRQVGWLCGTGCLRLRPDPTAINARYLFDALGRPETASFIAARAQGATMPNLNSKVVAPTPILVPPQQLQQRYSEFVTPIYEMIEGLAEQNQKLQSARDLLLPKLMSGEIAV